MQYFSLRDMTLVDRQEPCQPLVMHRSAAQLQAHGKLTILRIELATRKPLTLEILIKGSNYNQRHRRLIGGPCPPTVLVDGVIAPKRWRIQRQNLTFQTPPASNSKNNTFRDRWKRSPEKRGRSQLQH
ncbi:hypothetical protein PILCRDRAFT_399691 [Piloderma croceum F 1598]|uniref:Uncharacterized protein n=1 Tax=Piloderma croceum (strain F 1598) TaxID=765440 RepID=A0A0C3BCV1_PILCF|nr:hypothetical protein PILCRDRAFT_399691 [Piloderma croceum F 1598]